MVAECLRSTGMLLSTKDGAVCNRDALIGVVDMEAVCLPNLPYFLIASGEPYVMTETALNLR